MSNEPVQQALALFRQACELPKDERGPFLDEACGQDAELRRQVESMLAWDDTEDAAEDDPAVPHPVRAALVDLAEQAESGAAGFASIPEHLGAYRIVRLIAHGGMGVVYEARQENPERRVAIKVARAGNATTERTRRFELEAQLLARLRHPGIAQIIEAGTTSPETGAQPYFVMEYVDGQSLTDYADEHLPSARAKLELMVSVCEAVAFAHAQGVVHRDLKPDNVFVEAGGAPRVLDFGVAKVEEAGGFGAATLRTEAGRVLGTMGYMAPEQLGGRSEGIGPAADVYSLGVMIYELLSGRLPHELTAATLTRALAVVTTTDAPLLGVIRPEYRGDIEAVVAKALEKNTHDRYTDAAALQADLERCLRDEPVLARRHSALHRFRKFSRRNRGLVGGVAATIVALLLGLIAALYFLGQFQGKVREFNQLAVASRFVELEEELYPGLLENTDAIEAWRTRIKAWRDRRGEITELKHAIERTLHDLKARNEASGSLFDTLTKLQEDLSGLGAKLKVRVDQQDLWARKITELSENHPNARVTWNDARKAIAAADGVVASTLYAGQEFELRSGDVDGLLGLVPIGMNPVTKLWEFYHLRSAWDPTSGIEASAIEIPEHDPATGKITIAADTGIVFVLLPGGTFTMGAQRDDPDGEYFDPNAIVEQNCEALQPPAFVKPFFLSRCEMTQGQWQRIVDPGHPPESPCEPVGGVNWIRCTEVMRQLGLTLPDEFQWEYAARADTKTAWWTGPDVSTLEGNENLFDASAVKEMAVWTQKHRLRGPSPDGSGDRVAWDDGHVVPAPVGSFGANPFGLYDVHGNVGEWCSNAPDYRVIPPGSESKLPFRSIRGGNFRRSVLETRSAARNSVAKQFSDRGIGLRPAMAIQE